MVIFFLITIDGLWMSTDFKGSDIEWVIIDLKSLRRRINLPVKPKVIKEEKGRLVQETAPAGGQERPDEFFARSAKNRS